MRLLLDTHIFIWWDSDSDRLPAHALAACSDPSNNLLLSVASLWEMQIKAQLGKLHLHTPLREIVMQQQVSNGLELIPVDLAHVLQLDQLPTHHKDPFDRILVAQANVENAILISSDPVFAHSPVRLL